MPFENHQSLVSIGLFTIDIEQVTISGLKSMRKLLPRSEYILLKKRKSARVSRARGKNQKRSLIQIIENLRDENAKLRSQLGRSPVQNYSYDNDQSVGYSESGGASIRMKKVNHTEPSMMTAAKVDIEPVAIKCNDSAQQINCDKLQLADQSCDLFRFE